MNTNVCSSYFEQTPSVFIPNTSGRGDLMTSSSFTEMNRRAWDIRTKLHVGSEFYDVMGFKQGESTLKPPELQLVGDVKGKRLLHLQCHMGLDSLSWARMGAEVTGVDFSPKAIEIARKLSHELSLNAEFLEADVLDMDDLFDKGFDIVVSTYGVLYWLSDLQIWSKNVWQSLVPGGRFVLVEFHPILDVFHEGYVTGNAAYFPQSAMKPKMARGSYTDPEAAVTYEQVRWQHDIGRVVTVLAEEGLHIDKLVEYPYCSYPLFDGLEEQPDGMWRPQDYGRIPYMYGLAATRPVDNE